MFGKTLTVLYPTEGGRLDGGQDETPYYDVLAALVMYS